MCTGLHSVAESTETTLSAQIASSISSRLQSSSWQLQSDLTWEIPSELSGLIYFDSQGSMLPEANADVSYTARIEWEASGVSLPGALPHLVAESPANPFSRRVIIRIASGPARSERFFELPANARFIHATHTVVTTRLAIATSLP